MISGVPTINNVCIHRKGRSLHLRLRILKRDQEGLCAGACQGSDVLHIRCLQFRLPGDQRRPVVDGRNGAEHFRRERKKITAIQLQIRSFINVESSGHPAPRGYAVFHAKRFQRDGREFDAHHGMPTFSQPQKVKTLTAKRYEYAAFSRQFEIRPVPDQLCVDRGLMKTDLASAPAFVPKLGLQSLLCRIRSGFIARGRRFVRNPVLFTEPGAEIDESAAIAAERSIGRFWRPFHRALARGAFDYRYHADEPCFTRNRSVETAHPSRRARDGSWRPANSGNESYSDAGCR